MDTTALGTTISAAFAAFFASPAGLAVQGLLYASFLVFALGVVAAVRDKTFGWVFVDAFVRSTIMGRVVPLLIVLGTGYIAHQDMVTTAGVVAAGIVAAGMLASVVESIRQIASPPAESAARNEPPVA